MPNMLPLMKLPRDEELFLRHWIYDVHYQQAQGPAKRLRLQHRAIPADLALLVAAAMPDTIDEEAAGPGPPPDEAPTWPWSEDTWQRRIVEARAFLVKSSLEPE
jgi:hypothetical protein